MKNSTQKNTEITVGNVRDYIQKEFGISPAEALFFPLENKNDREVFYMINQTLNHFTGNWISEFTGCLLITDPKNRSDFILDKDYTHFDHLASIEDFVTDMKNILKRKPELIKKHYQGVNRFKNLLDQERDDELER